MRAIILDSSVLVCRVLEKQLTSLGWQVEIAHDGKEAFRLIQKKVPELCIIDQNLEFADADLLQLYFKTRNIQTRVWRLTYADDEFPFFSRSPDLAQKIEKHILEHTWEENQQTLPAAQSVEDLLIQLQSEDRSIHRWLGDLGDLLEKNRDLNSYLNGLVEHLRKRYGIDSTAFSLVLEKKPLFFVGSSRKMNESAMQDFIKVSLADVNDLFPELEMDKLELRVLDQSDDMTGNGSVKSYLHFPLKNKDVSYGAVHFASTEEHFFNDSLAGFLVMYLKKVEAIVDVFLRSFIAEDKERAIRRSFAKFVPEDIIDTLVRRENTAQQMVGEKRTVAILFSDIRSFTTITELNRAEDLVAFLNRYFAVMGEIIEKHGGTIDKFIGDAILAVFGAPRSYPDNAHRAVKAAMEMVESLDSIPRENIQLPDGVFATGIGVHEGSAIVGNIGSKNKFDYTVIGDAVNLASRLEGLTKHYKQKIIVSDSVYDRLKTEVLFRPLDFVKVKGKNESTMIYSIEMDLESSLVGDTLDCFVRGLKLYRMRNWTGALEQFRKVLEERPNDSVTFVFIDRCLELMEKPPDESWDGSVSLDFK